MNVTDIVRRYQAYLDGRLKRKEVVEEYVATTRYALRLFVDAFGMRDDAQLRQHDLSEHLAQHPQWKAVGTRRRHIAAILACFRWAHHQELIQACPYRAPMELRGLANEI